MVDILKVIVFIHLFAYVTDVIVIAVVAYLFSRNITTSILIALISYIVMWMKNNFLDRKWLNQ